MTERRNPVSLEIDALDARGILDVMHREDRAAVEAVRPALDVIAGLVDRVVDAFRSGGRLVYIGAGTSGRLGVLDASECPPTFGVEPGLVVGVIAGGDRALRESIEGAEDSRPDGASVMRELEVGDRDVVCGIAASGSTPFVLGALAEARERGAATALVTANALSTDRRRELDHVIEILVGPEVITGSTRLKAGTATKLVLNMITTAAMVRIGKVHDNLMVDVRPVNAKLVARARRLVAEVGEVMPERAAELLEASGRDVKVAIVMTRCGLDAAAAAARLEGAEGSLRRALS